MDRQKTIIRASVTGIIANVLLAAFKAAVGLFTNSIAVTLDAVNNLSDVLSSVITIIGTKLAGKRPDKKHPYGYGRIEYLSAVTISVIVLYAGVSALVESVKKIISPETPEYTPVALIIIAVAVAVKLALGSFVRAAGVRVRSDALIASGKDALLDAVISASTLVAAGIFMIWGLSLEAWLGAVIALFIIRSGIEMLRGSVSSILGERVDSEISGSVIKTVLGFEQVSGVYDVVLHNYGPNTYTGSVHIEVPDTMTVSELDALERRIAEKVYAENGVALTGISVYSANTDDETLAVMNDVRRTVMGHEGAIQFHGFSIDRESKEIRFDVVIGYEVRDRGSLYKHILYDVQQKYPDYRLIVTLDSDFSL